jgi:hypothetical protein
MKLEHRKYEGSAMYFGPDNFYLSTLQHKVGTSSLFPPPFLKLV